MNKYLPSKKFIKFFGLVLLVVGLILLISFLFSRKTSYQNKNKGKDLTTSEDLGLYTLDSDSDGVYDWEEGLWGTNSRDDDSDDDGIPDGDEISIRKKNLQAENGVDGNNLENEDDLTQTEVFARQFIATASLVDQSGGLTPEALSGFSSSLKSSIEGATIKDPFTLINMKLGSVTPEQYKKSLELAFADYLAANKMDLEIIFNYSQGVAGMDKEVATLIKLYSDLSNKLLNTEAPHGAAGPHLGMVNNSSKVAIALMNIEKLDSDPLLSMIGLKQYKEYAAALEKNITSLNEYFY